STDAFLHSPAPPAPYTLSLPDALPIFPHILLRAQPVLRWSAVLRPHVCRHSLRQSVRVLCRHSNALHEGANAPLLHGCRQLPFRLLSACPNIAYKKCHSRCSHKEPACHFRPGGSILPLRRRLIPFE